MADTLVSSLEAGACLRGGTGPHGVVEIVSITPCDWPPAGEWVTVRVRDLAPWRGHADATGESRPVIAERDWHYRRADLVDLASPRVI